ncbi:hypothetical protein [Nocardioides sp. SYSU D00038]|uniref:hypothetical protein n=1 Tax=Nocardioides sp. SYSU D00038 TaxID=2812554 RepID=UPI0019686360|nr:hypothetical protein [Nocardioides sp. SYSU D00038]
MHHHRPSSARLATALAVAALLAPALATSSAAAAPRPAVAPPSAAGEPVAAAPVLDRGRPRNKPAVTREEYRRVRRGMSIARVHKVFGTAGKRTGLIAADPAAGQPAQQSREYRVQGSKWGFVTVYYVQGSGSWVVTRKAAYWG